jgi:hypothetical protein
MIIHDFELGMNRQIVTEETLTSVFLHTENFLTERNTGRRTERKTKVELCNNIVCVQYGFLVCHWMILCVYRVFILKRNRIFTS